MIDKGRFLAITVFITAHTAILEELKPYQHPNNYYRYLALQKFHLRSRFVSLV